MTFTVSSLEGGALRIVIEGELDAVTAAEVRKDVDQVCASNPRRVEVDLSTLRMIDSSGVGTLVSIYKRVRAQGGEVVMVACATSRWRSSACCAWIRSWPAATSRAWSRRRRAPVANGAPLTAPPRRVSTARS